RGQGRLSLDGNRYASWRLARVCRDQSQRAIRGHGPGAYPARQVDRRLEHIRSARYAATAWHRPQIDRTLSRTRSQSNSKRGPSTTYAGGSPRRGGRMASPIPAASRWTTYVRSRITGASSLTLTPLRAVSIGSGTSE